MLTVEVIQCAIDYCRHIKIRSDLVSVCSNAGNSKALCICGNTNLVEAIFSGQGDTVYQRGPGIVTVCKPIVKFQIFPLSIVLDVNGFLISVANRYTVMLITTINTLAAAVELVENDGGVCSFICIGKLECVYFFAINDGVTISCVRESAIVKACLCSYPRIVVLPSNILVCELIVCVVRPVTVVNVNVLTSKERCCCIQRLFGTVLLGVTNEHTATTVSIPLICRCYVGEYVKLCRNNYVFHLNSCIAPLAADNATAKGVEGSPKRGNNNGRVNCDILECVAVALGGICSEITKANFANNTTGCAVIVCNLRVCYNNVFKVAGALRITNYDTDVNALENDVCATDSKVLDGCILNGSKETAACCAVGVRAVICLVRIKVPTVLIEVVNGVISTVKGTHEYLTIQMCIVVTNGIEGLIGKVDVNTKLYGLACESVATVNKISKAGKLLCRCKCEHGIIFIIPRGIGCAIPLVRSCLNCREYGEVINVKHNLTCCRIVSVLVFDCKISNTVHSPHLNILVVEFQGCVAKVLRKDCAKVNGNAGAVIVCYTLDVNIIASCSVCKVAACFNVLTRELELGCALGKLCACRNNRVCSGSVTDNNLCYKLMIVVCADTLKRLCCFKVHFELRPLCIFIVIIAKRIAFANILRSYDLNREACVAEGETFILVACVLVHMHSHSNNNLRADSKSALGSKVVLVVQNIGKCTCSGKTVNRGQLRSCRIYAINAYHVGELAYRSLCLKSKAPFEIEIPLVGDFDVLYIGISGLPIIMGKNCACGGILPRRCVKIICPLHGDIQVTGLDNVILTGSHIREPRICGA